MVINGYRHGHVAYVVRRNSFRGGERESESQQEKFSPFSSRRLRSTLLGNAVLDLETAAVMPLAWFGLDHRGIKESERERDQDMDALVLALHTL